ncbi:MAG: TonB family protein [Limisphaerales bacterium]
MDRLQQKCFVASAGLHLLLAVILVIGPAFLASKSKSDNSPILDVIPGKLIDAAFSGGGNPNAKPPPPAPLAPPAPQVAQPAPQPERVKAPEPVKVREPEPPQKPVEEVRPAKPDPNSLETSTDHKRKKPEVSTTPITRKQDIGKSVKTPSTTPSTDNEERRYADARRRAADLIGATARSLRDDVSPGTTLEPFGPGGGGEVYAPYDDAVKSIYWHAWIPPEDTASDAAITKATVTIASDGTVLSARIITPSGDASVDKSVQRALDRVTFIAPFPEGAKDKERTYTIKFDLKARRLTR